MRLKSGVFFRGLAKRGTRERRVGARKRARLSGQGGSRFVVIWNTGKPSCLTAETSLPYQNQGIYNTSTFPPTTIQLRNIINFASYLLSFTFRLCLNHCTICLHSHGCDEKVARWEENLIKHVYILDFLVMESFGKHTRIIIFFTYLFIVFFSLFFFIYCTGPLVTLFT